MNFVVLPEVPVLSGLQSYQSCRNFVALPKMRQVGYELPNFQQVWLIYAKLAVNMAIQAILGAFPAALFRQYQLGAFPAALFQQY
ncbi:MAG: hypothetical protein HXK26_02660 [Lancefieldella rimae]|uniref:Uncharacterized protein n=1 Tax=Lancefieldella rimae TaxID=1383 RepID=A0A930W118_9ACTN|nr:hypothetical protein [Lancefieldella rimae]